MTRVELARRLTRGDAELAAKLSEGDASGVGSAHSTVLVATRTNAVKAEVRRNGSYGYQEARYVCVAMAKATERKKLLNRFIGARLATERPSYTYDALVARYGISKPQIVKLVATGTGGGDETFTRFAAVHFGGSLDALYAEAQRWEGEAGAKDKGEPEVTEDLRIAIEMARRDNMQDAFIREFVARHNGGAGSERTASAWWTQVRAAYEDWSEKRPVKVASTPLRRVKSK